MTIENRDRTLGQLLEDLEYEARTNGYFGTDPSETQILWAEVQRLQKLDTKERAP